MNVISILGNVGFIKKIDTGSQGPCLNISVCTNKRSKDKFGENHQESVWYNVALYGKRVDYFHTTLKKGQKIFVCGELSPREYKGKDGTNKTMLNIVNVYHIEILFMKDGNDKSPAGGVTMESDNIPF